MDWIAHYKQEAAIEKKAEERAKKKIVDRKLPALPKRYARKNLEAAYNYWKTSGKYPYNPRRLDPVSLMDIDQVWCNEFNLYVAGIEWAKNNTM